MKNAPQPMAAGRWMRGREKPETVRAPYSLRRRGFRLGPAYPSHLRQQNLVDDVDDAVRLLDIGDRDVGDVAVLVLDGDLVALVFRRPGAAADGLDRMRALVVVDHLHDIARQSLGRDDM